MDAQEVEVPEFEVIKGANGTPSHVMYRCVTATGAGAHYDVRLRWSMVLKLLGDLERDSATKQRARAAKKIWHNVWAPPWQAYDPTFLNTSVRSN